MFAASLASRPGAAPLLIHYDEASGARVELSGVTFRNWVDKTANLLEDLGVEPGDVVHLELATTHPGHWVTAVWVAGIWQRGCTVATDQDDAALAVVGPGSATRGPMTVMCSLHPLGRAVPDLPVGCIDFAEVLVQPDVHWAADPANIAWAPDLSHQDIALTSVSVDRRLIADPPPGWGTIAQLLVAPVLGGGSTVVVIGATPERLARIAAQERAVTAP